MTDLSDILHGAYQPLSVMLNDKARRFLRHFAQLAGETEEAMAEQLILSSLTLEAEILTRLLNDDQDQNPHQAMNAAPPTASGSVAAIPSPDLFGDDELEEMAREHVNLPDPPE